MADAFVALLVIHLHFPDVSSLKGKRRELAPVKARLRQRHGASVAEVAHHDEWQRATLAASLTAGEEGRLHEAADRVCGWLDAQFEAGARVERFVMSQSDLDG